MKKLVCIENDWEDWQGSRSVSPILELATKASGQPAKHFHRSCNTVEELDFNIEKVSNYTSIDLVYFALHGSSGKIHIGGHPLSLTELGEKIGYRWKGRVVHFGSCSVFRNQNEVDSFIQLTGVSAVSGFCRTIDWHLSTAFDYLYLINWLNYSRVGDFMNKMHKIATGPFEELGFVTNR
ncbi:DUF6642 family protein [Hymenobacter koreensis]|uniref:CHAT domain-containing protein n=1 Tax=Hymenobacter koreensis TaxID=1084523 RepID=A0ABP8IXU2_9BACT